MPATSKTYTHGIYETTVSYDPETEEMTFEFDGHPEVRGDSGEKTFEGIPPGLFASITDWKSCAGAFVALKTIEDDARAAQYDAAEKAGAFK